MRKISDGVNERITSIRDKTGLSQENFAHYIGTTQGHLSGLESGVKKPSGSLLTVIALRHGILEDWLFTGRGRKYPKNGDS